VVDETYPLTSANRQQCEMLTSRSVTAQCLISDSPENERGLAGKPIEGKQQSVELTGKVFVQKIRRRFQHEIMI
jgi:hypothetical protein